MAQVTEVHRLEHPGEPMARVRRMLRPWHAAARCSRAEPGGVRHGESPTEAG